jgi:hypothetical protein
MNARPTPTVPKPHCEYTGLKDSRNVKIRASLKPLRSDSHRTIGSVKNM